MDGIDPGASATGFILGGVGTDLLATIVSAPEVPIILVVAAGYGLASAESKVVTRRLRAKAQKHDQIHVLAESKLNSVSDLVSKALEDGTLSHEEFKTVTDEVLRYTTFKKKIRVGAKKESLELDEATRKELIERGRHSFLKKIGAESSS